MGAFAFLLLCCMLVDSSSDTKTFEMGRVKKEKTNVGISKSNRSKKVDCEDSEDSTWWRKIDSKSQNIKKRNSSNVFEWDNMYSVIKKMLPVNEKLTNKIEKFIPRAIECVSLSVPKYMNYLLPLAINKVIPSPFAGVAYDVANETVVPYLVDNVLSDETRMKMAIDNSLRDRKFSEIDLS